MREPSGGLTPTPLICGDARGASGRVYKKAPRKNSVKIDYIRIVFVHGRITSGRVQLVQRVNAKMAHILLQLPTEACAVGMGEF